MRVRAAVLAEPLERLPVAVQLESVPSPGPYTQMERSRSAVICEFSCLSEPAAALRGFGAVFFPSAARRSFSLTNAESGK